MKFVGFINSSLSFSCFDILHDATFKGILGNAYLIEAKNFEQAKRIFYQEFYVEDKTEIRELASKELMDIREDYSKEELCKKFGEKDGEIIFNILEISYDRYGEIVQDTYDYYYQETQKLSWGTIKVLAYEKAYPDILLFRIDSEISYKDFSERQDYL